MEYVPFLRFHMSSAEAEGAVSALLFVGGLIALLYGWRFYRILLVVSCALAAAYLGWYFLGGMVDAKYAYFVALGAGLAGALAAIPIQSSIVFLLGAMIGFVSLGPVAAEVIWRAPDGPTPTQYLVAGVAAFVVMGIFALLLLRPAIVIATSMLGATLLLSGAVHVIEAASTRRHDIYAKYPVEMGWAYIALVVVGVVFQATVAKRQEKSE